MPAYADGDGGQNCSTEPCQMQQSGGGKIGDCAGKPNGTDCTSSHPDGKRTEIAVCINQSCTAIKCTTNNYLYWQKTAKRDLHSTGRCYSVSQIQKLCKTACEESAKCVPTYDQIEWHKDYNKKRQPVDRAYCDHIPDPIPGPTVTIPTEPTVVTPVTPTLPVIEIKYCDLQFSNNQAISGVDNGESAHSTSKNYNIVNYNNNAESVSRYFGKDPLPIIANIYQGDPDVPHLFALEKVNGVDIDSIANFGATRAELQDALYARFTCNDGNPKIQIETRPKLRQTRANCIDDHCLSVSIFEQIDPFLEANFTGSSVWKNEEGKFNTARLASDSIAGVVLGTVGGVVTSTVIKKNQVKKGFEDLKCTIGGQDVASFGDEFTVKRM